MRGVTVAVRDWDWITPIRVGEVDLSSFARMGVDLRITPVQTLPELDGNCPPVSETSMSRFVRGWAKGLRTRVGTPIIMMQAFRQHCIIVRKDSKLNEVGQLKGHTVGLTGWIDSGNTWTKALLEEAGVSLRDVHWIAGRLTASHPIEDRLSGYRSPGWIESDPEERPMVDMLECGDLDAVMTPFMPPRFFSPDSPFRLMYPDVIRAEADYYDKHHYVPGMHILSVDAETFRRYPDLMRELARVLNESRTIWKRKRAKYMDTSPWFVSALIEEGEHLEPGWDEWSLGRQRAMIEDFIGHQRSQGILDGATDIDDMFGRAGI